MDISQIIINHADLIEQGIEYLLVAYVGGNILPNKFVNRVTKHFPASDIIRGYFKKKKVDKDE